jgi:hypothetical protein
VKNPSGALSQKRESDKLRLRNPRVFGREGVMAGEQVPRSTPPWLVRLRLSGKLLAIGGVAGVVVAFLPLASVSLQVQGPGGINLLEMMGGANQPLMSATKTTMVVEDWRGKVGLAGYVAALILAFVLYPPNGLGQKALCWAAVGVGLLVAVLAIWLLFLALDTRSADLMGMGSLKATVGIGAVLNVVAGALVAAGVFLETREERLI